MTRPKRQCRRRVHGWKADYIDGPVTRKSTSEGTASFCCSGMKIGRLDTLYRLHRRSSRYSGPVRVGTGPSEPTSRQFDPRLPLGCGSFYRKQPRPLGAVNDRGQRPLGPSAACHLWTANAPGGLQVLLVGWPISFPLKSRHNAATQVRHEYRNHHSFLDHRVVFIRRAMGHQFLQLDGCDAVGDRRRLCRGFRVLVPQGYCAGSLGKLDR